jgi:hypothetical protein
MWSGIEESLRYEAQSDVIAFLNCCFASNAALKAVGGTSRKYQLVAASPPEMPAYGPGSRSFSKCLADSLEELVYESEGAGFPLTKLLERINRVKGRGGIPAMLWDRLNSFGRPIHLAPLNKNRRRESGISPRTGEPEEGAVILRFSLKDYDLTFKQIEAWARQLPQACKDADIAVRRIEWVKSESHKKPSSARFRATARTLMAAQAFRSRTGVTDKDAENTEQREGKRKRSAPSRSVSPVQKRVKHNK